MPRSTKSWLQKLFTGKLRRLVHRFCTNHCCRLSGVLLFNMAVGIVVSGPYNDQRRIDVVEVFSISIAVVVVVDRRCIKVGYVAVGFVGYSSKTELYTFSIALSMITLSAISLADLFLLVLVHCQCAAVPAYSIVLSGNYFFSSCIDLAASNFVSASFCLLPWSFC